MKNIDNDCGNHFKKYELSKSIAQSLIKYYTIHFLINPSIIYQRIFDRDTLYFLNILAFSSFISTIYHV